MMCVASAGMAIALLLRPSVALLSISLLAVASGLILNNELRFTLITMGSSLVGIMSVATLRNRGDFLRATLVLCGANVGLNVLVGLLEGDPSRELLSGAVWGAVSGVFALALFYTGVAVFERWFGITTHLRLLELSDPATPVLQEFRMRVPGTYAHSLMVGNLAHAAAEAIGADALLVRVAAYYHDLGKMNRPDFFIENQSGCENVHDRISPSLSALVLASHVKEGIEMGQAIGLPPRVLEVIQQHHGTQLMKFFYHRATGGSGNPSLEPQFRYAGPKPQTREAAILMLADGVEAASRTLEKPTPQRIADFVKRMVDDKLQDGQLDECDLTLRDLRTIHDVFSRTLSGTLHARISYPDDKKPGDGPPTLTPPALTLATFPEEALSGALRVTPPDVTVVEPGGPDRHTGGGNGTHHTNGPIAGGEGASLAFARGGRRNKAVRGGG
jgi:putative nucleotidyltransferase with HDIG domain